MVFTLMESTNQM